MAAGVDSNSAPGSPVLPGPLGVTRLAPSPTGALHLGNARTFLVNWALARQRGWRIVLRIEDLDGPRVKAGAIEGTIEILRWLGVDWDEGPTVQSADLEPYRRAMEELAGRGLVYPSELSRQEIADAGAASAASAPQEGVHEIAFPASLRPSERPGHFDREECNWRFVTPEGRVEFTDEFAGVQRHDPARIVGDFLVWTKRGAPAYQLAVVVDDFRQGVTHVVRGDDLLDSAARQLLLYRALGYRQEPAYLHLPLVRGSDGKRLAKRHGDTRLDAYRARGVPATRVLGLVAYWSGMVEKPRGVTSEEFRERLDLRTIPHESVVFSAEDDRWLLSGTH